MKISQKEILYSDAFRMILISIAILLIVSLFVRKMVLNKFEAVVKEVYHIEIDCYQTQKILGTLKHIQANHYQGVQDLTAGDDITYGRETPYVFSELTRLLNQKEDIAKLTTKRVRPVINWHLEKRELSDQLNYLKEKYESIAGLYPKSIDNPKLENQLHRELQRDIGSKLKNVIFEATVINTHAANNFKNIAIANYQEAIKWSNVFCLIAMVLGALTLLYILAAMIVEFCDDWGKMRSVFKKTNSV